jgi:hypothetical protein
MPGRLAVLPSTGSPAVPKSSRYAITSQTTNHRLPTENVMGKGNNSQKNDKKSKKPKQGKLKGMKAAAKK